MTKAWERQAIQNNIISNTNQGDRKCHFKKHFC